MKAALRNIKLYSKSPHYIRVLNNRACTIIFFQSSFPYVRSLLGTVPLLLWTNFLSCTFILNCAINQFEHFLSNCFNKKKQKKTLNLLLFCEVSHNLKENDNHYSIMILKSVSPGYHLNKKYTPPQKLF